MAFLRELAAATLVGVAEGLQAQWTEMAAETRSHLERLVDEYGHEIYQKNAANRAGSMVRLLDKIAELPDLPQPVRAALEAGSGALGVSFVRVSDEQRDEVLAALVRVYDARRYDEPYQLADEVRGLVTRGLGELDPALQSGWEQLGAQYRSGDINVNEYLDGVNALLGERYPEVRAAIRAGKSWAAVPRLSARPPMDGSKGLAEPEVLPGFAAPPGDGGRGKDEAPQTAGPPEIPAPTAPVLVQRATNVYFPQAVQLAQKLIPLIVHIAREQVTGTVEVKQGSSDLKLAVGDLKIFVLTADFTIERAIGGAGIEDVDHGRIVRIDPANDSEPVVFFLSPTSAGEKRISIEFKQFGKRIGSLAFDVSVIEEAVPVTRLLNAIDNRNPFPIAAAGLTATQVLEAPDLDLRVGRQGNILSYALSSADGKYDEKKLGQKELQVDPGPYFADIAMQLSDLAARKPEHRTEDDKALPGQLGAQLWDQLLSPEFRQIYRDDLRVNYQGKSLKITTDEPWIPWEMLRPVEFQDGAFLVDDPPLCETFRLTRWLDGWGAPARVQLRHGVIVAPPEETLPSVAEELAYFAALPWVAPARSKEEATRELREGAGELFHFSCHGGVDPSDAWLKLGDEYLKSKSILYGREYNLSLAFVFVNACEAGQTTLGITGLDGWAQAFLRRNASIFIGSLWSINDRLATQFSRTFYDSLFGLHGREPQSVGAAFQAARQAIKAQDPYNPTWLAYVLYGDPNGRVYVGQ